MAATMVAAPHSRDTPDLYDRTLTRASDLSYRYGGTPGVQLGGALDKLREDRDTYAVWVVVIVAVAIIIVTGLIIYAMTICIRRGGNFTGGLTVKTNGWKVWEYRLGIQCTR